MCALIIKILFAIIVTATLPRSTVAGGLSKRCGVLKTVILKRVCTGRYTQDMKIKYHDKHVKPGDQYAIFAFEDEENRYFVSFHRNLMHRCEKVGVLSTRSFQCDIGRGSNRTINIAEGFIYCLPLHMEMVDELLRDCKASYARPTVFAALHYAGDKVFNPSLEIAQGSIGLRRMSSLSSLSTLLLPSPSLLVGASALTFVLHVVRCCYDDVAGLTQI